MSKQNFPEWIALEDEKPKQGHNVLIFAAGFIASATVDMNLYKDGRIRWDQYGVTGLEREWEFNERDVTHWMPLPPEPRQRTVVEGSTEPASPSGCTPTIGPPDLPNTHGAT